MVNIARVQRLWRPTDESPTREANGRFLRILPIIFTDNRCFATAALNSAGGCICGVQKASVIGQVLSPIIREGKNISQWCGGVLAAL